MDLRDRKESGAQDDVRDCEECGAQNDVRDCKESGAHGHEDDVRDCKECGAHGHEDDVRDCKESGAHGYGRNRDECGAQDDVRDCFPRKAGARRDRRNREECGAQDDVRDRKESGAHDDGLHDQDDQRQQQEPPPADDGVSEEDRVLGAGGRVVRPELEGAEMQAGKQEAAEEEHEYLNAHMTHGRRVGAESSLRDAGDMGNNGIDGVFAEIPANGGGVAKFARDGGVTPIKSEREYVTTRADRRRTIALSGVQGRVERLSAGEVITAFSNNTGRLAPGRAAKVLDCQSRNVANWFYQRGGSVQSNVKAADVSGNGGRDDLPGHVLSAARPCHVLPSGESRHWWLRGASRPRGHQ